MEFTRQSLAVLQKIKRLAKEEQGCIIHFDSPNLEQELRLLVKSGVSAALLALIEEFLPQQEPPSTIENGGRYYRGTPLLLDDKPRTADKDVRIYRGQIVSS